MKRSPLLLIALSALVAPMAVNAISFEFFKLEKAGVLVAGELNPIAGSGFVHNNDWVGNPTLIYTVDGLTVTASSTYDSNPADLIPGVQSVPVQDREANWVPLGIDPPKGAGLGVYSNPFIDSLGVSLDSYDEAVLKDFGTDPYIKASDDNIDAGEELLLAFDKVVTITKIYLSANGHNYTDWLDDSTFFLNGVEYDLPKNVGYITGMWTDSNFLFSHSGGYSSHDNNEETEDFYVSALELTVRVPDSGSSILILGATLTCLLAAARRLNPIKP